MWAYQYDHTDQWRYDGYGADKLASPVGRGRFAGRHTMDLLASSATSRLDRSNCG
ncbi:hypothetical protein MAHJHV57_54580 [Mycobacterium avium subsp. hominissuis]